MAEEKRRVAVVVFMEATGVDENDAAVHAMMALRQTLFGRPYAAMGRELAPVLLRGKELEPTIVHEMREVGMAAGNGYLWTTPTIKAFPRKD